MVVADSHAQERALRLKDPLIGESEVSGYLSQLSIISSVSCTYIHVSDEFSGVVQSPHVVAQSTKLVQLIRGYWISVISAAGQL